MRLRRLGGLRSERTVKIEIYEKTIYHYLFYNIESIVQYKKAVLRFLKILREKTRAFLAEVGTTFAFSYIFAERTAHVSEVLKVDQSCDAPKAETLICLCSCRITTQIGLHK